MVKKISIEKVNGRYVTKKVSGFDEDEKKKKSYIKPKKTSSKSKKKITIEKGKITKVEGFEDDLNRTVTWDKEDYKISRPEYKPTPTRKVVIKNGNIVSDVKLSKDEQQRLVVKKITNEISKAIKDKDELKLQEIKKEIQRQDPESYRIELALKTNRPMTREQFLSLGKKEEQKQSISTLPKVEKKIIKEPKFTVQPSTTFKSEFERLKKKEISPKDFVSSGIDITKRRFGLLESGAREQAVRKQESIPAQLKSAAFGFTKPFRDVGATIKSASGFNFFGFAESELESTKTPKRIKEKGERSIKFVKELPQQLPTGDQLKLESGYYVGQLGGELALDFLTGKAIGTAFDTSKTTRAAKVKRLKNVPVVYDDPDVVDIIRGTEVGEYDPFVRELKKVTDVKYQSGAGKLRFEYDVKKLDLGEPVRLMDTEIPDYIEVGRRKTTAYVGRDKPTITTQTLPDVQPTKQVRYSNIRREFDVKKTTPESFSKAIKEFTTEPRRKIDLTDKKFDPFFDKKITITESVPKGQKLPEGADFFKRRRQGTRTYTPPKKGQLPDMSKWVTGTERDKYFPKEWYETLALESGQRKRIYVFDDIRYGKRSPQVVFESLQAYEAPASAFKAFGSVKKPKVKKPKAPEVGGVDVDTSTFVEYVQPDGTVLRQEIKFEQPSQAQEQKLSQKQKQRQKQKSQTLEQQFEQQQSQKQKQYEEQQQKYFQDQQQQQSQKQKQSQKQGQRYDQSYRFVVGQLPKQDQLFKQKQDQKQRQDSKIIRGQIIDGDQIIGQQIDDIEIIGDQEIEIPDPIGGGDPIIEIFKPEPEPPEPEPPEIKKPRKPIFPAFTRDPKRKVKVVPEYSARSKIFGKWTTVRSGMTKAQALDYGAKYALETASASFRVKPTGRKIPFSKDTDYFEKNRNKFRMTRSKKEKIPTYVEKAKYRIDSPFELGEITFKGLSAKSKGSKKKVKSRKQVNPMSFL